MSIFKDTQHWCTDRYAGTRAERKHRRVQYSERFIVTTSYANPALHCGGLHGPEAAVSHPHHDPEARRRHHEGPMKLKRGYRCVNMLSYATCGKTDVK